MKKVYMNAKGITLIALVVTVIVLLILASVATYSGIQLIESSKLTTFTAEMKIMQTHVNELYEQLKSGKISNEEIGKSLEYNTEVEGQVNKVLKTVLDIEDTTGYRYFDQDTIQDLGIEGVKQEFFINVEKRDVVSYKGLKYHGEMYYTLIQLPQGLYNVDYEPQKNSAPTFDVSYEKIGEGKWRITISNIKYDGYIDKWTVKYQLQGKSYQSTTEDLSFVVNEAGTYDITIENGNVKSEIKNITIGNENSPELSEGMIPVKYENGKWLKANKNNKDNSWYEYGIENKKWANIVTVNEDVRAKYTNASEGTEIDMDDVTTMFVWIPRYSYEIAGEKDINISFLQGNTNKEIDGDITTKTVHPAFNMNGVELKGIWVAKFEASGINKNGEIVGNATSTSSNTASTEGAYVTVKPSVASWRHITIGESQYQSMKINTDSEHYGLTNVNSHLMKNAEWGAVAYLCYSDYGEVPQINACGSYNSTSGYYDLMTGAGPLSNGVEDSYEYNSSTFLENNAYNTENGRLASTTGNETGIYDMNGGATERVATFLDNKNVNLLNNGNSATDSSVEYFNSNNELNSNYNVYWEKYEVTEEERNDQIQVQESDGTTTILKHSQLWNVNNIEAKYQEARLKLTQANFNLMAQYKGIGVNEVSSSFSYYGAYKDDSGTNVWGWFITLEQQGYIRTWDNDYVCIGQTAWPFIQRGAIYNSNSGAGVLNSDISNGRAYDHASFRPVLAF